MSSVGRGLVAIDDESERVRQIARFRRWRPWTWGALALLWTYSFEQMTIDYMYGPVTYRWGRVTKERDHDRSGYDPVRPPH